MLQISGYRLPFPSAPMLCPLCTVSPGNLRSVPLQPCCFYPAEMYPVTHVQLPVDSSSPFRLPSFQSHGIASKLRNMRMPPVSAQFFQTSQVENVTQVQTARDSSDDVNLNNGELKIISLA